MSNNEIWVDHHIIRRQKPKENPFLWLWWKLLFLWWCFFCIYNLNVDGYLFSCFCKSYIYHQQVVCCVGKLSYKILYKLFMSFFPSLDWNIYLFFLPSYFWPFFLKHLKCDVPQDLMVKILIILWKLMLSENFIRFSG